MTLDVTQQKYEAALQRLINNKPASSGVKISCDDVAKAALHTCSSGGKHSRPKVRALKNKAQRIEIVEDDVNS